MKKTMILAVALAASVAGASELWWTVNSTDVAPGDWDTARVYYFDSTDESLAGKLGTPLPGTATQSDLDILDYAASTIPAGSLSAYSFYVELYNSQTMDPNDHSTAWRSNAATYQELVNAKAIYAGGTSYGASPYEFSTFTQQVIPEPSSGLMMLLGMIALGLKRKKV